MGEIWRGGVRISYTAPRQISAPSVQGSVLGKKAENIQPNFGIYTPLTVEPLTRLLQNFDALCMGSFRLDGLKYWTCWHVNCPQS